jgi:hypothetical protein
VIYLAALLVAVTIWDARDWRERLLLSALTAIALSRHEGWMH